MYCQVPVELHVWGWSGLRALHCLVPGVQEPVQAPLLQTLGHGVPVFCQVPVESHVWGWRRLRGLHCLAPGVHAPAQVEVAALQTYWHGSPALCQVPLASQVWGWSALHFSAPGVQDPLQAPPLHR